MGNSLVSTTSFKSLFINVFTALPLNVFLSLLLFSGFFSLAAIAQQQTVVLTTGTTWTIPPNADLSSITAECWGAGGGGSRTSDDESAGGGGGGGAYAKTDFTSFTTGQTITYEIGIGGSGASGTNAGGDTWFFANNATGVMAVGGKGAANDSENGAAGGLAGSSIGDVTQNGGNGGNGSYTSGWACGDELASGGGGAAATPGSTGAAGGNGDTETGNLFCSGNHATPGSGGSNLLFTGYTSTGGNGVENSADSGTDDGPGNNGTYGGGGSGATSNTYNGGNGGDGLIRITYTEICFVNGTDTQTACGSYDWIDGNTYTSDNTTAVDTLFDQAANGCDSIVSLDLTINQPTTGDTAAVACESFNWYGTNYTSTSTPTHTLTNAVGCDSVVTLDLTINASTTGTDTQTACGSYDWIDGNTYTSDNNSATHTLTTVNGCDSVVTLDLTIESPPTVDATSSRVICEGEVLNLTATTVNGGTYQWTGPNGFTSQNQNPTINATGAFNTGTYEVIASIGNNCTDTAQVNVIVRPSPILNASVVDDSCSSEIGEITLNAVSPNTPLAYSWDNGSTDSFLTELSEGIFKVTVTDTASCSISQSFQIFNNIDGCNCFVYVANAFSPNGDNNNDLLPVRGWCITSLTFIVFNQWGDLVFETDQTNDGWDGTYKGKPQNTGVFVYTLEVTFSNGKTTKESGDINLIR